MQPCMMTDWLRLKFRVIFRVFICTLTLYWYFAKQGVIKILFLQIRIKFLFVLYYHEIAQCQGYTMKYWFLSMLTNNSNNTSIKKFSKLGENFYKSYHHVVTKYDIRRNIVTSFWKHFLFWSIKFLRNIV